SGNVPLILFAIPDETTRENRFEISIPNVASLILKHSASGVLPGLNDFVTDDGEVMHPPVAPVFFGFRVMVGIGILMLLVSFKVAITLYRHGEPKRWEAMVLVGMTFSGWVATLAGWYVTEIGRQPWIVTGVLDTSSAAADHPLPILGLSLATYLIVYIGLLSAYIGTLWHMAKNAANSDEAKDLDPGQFKGAVVGALS
ncbi:MAG: cytochrome d ubiquinol oxidase subunit I, partial [bacterium]